MSDTAAIEKSALLWRLGLSGVLDVPEPDAEQAALFAEADALVHGKRDGRTAAPSCVGNIFNVFSGKGNGEDTFFPFSLGDIEKPLPYPTAETAPVDMEAVRRFWREKLEARAWQERSMNDLLRLAELSTVLVSSSTERPDVSLYDEARLTAATAACLSLCTEESGASLAELREKPSFLLVSGDLAGGIQQFIYTIPSKGALRSLRGRSFYLDVLLENLVDEILEVCGLSRSCRLYAGGGHFYLLLPATEKVRSLLASFEEETNQWLLEHFGSRLYLALAWAEGTGADVGGEMPGGVGGMFRKVYEILAQKKLRRYSTEQLGMMFSPESGLNKTKDQSRECGVCHTSTAAVGLKPYPPEGEKGTLACGVCRNLYEMGDAMLEGDGFLLSLKQEGNALPLPGHGRTLYLSAIPKDSKPAGEERVRIYWKNQRYHPEEDASYLWLGDYVTKRNDQVLEFEKLAKESGGETGIDRLAVLRADVDNLGAAFVAGFSEENASLARSATLSRQLSVFFKRYINDICKGRLASGQQPFFLLRGKKAASRKVHIVYSGGDDLFLVGAWDDLIELAVDIRRAFRKFTNGKLTFSAGVGFFKPSVPISTMARETGQLEDEAKDNAPEKDSIALFGTPADTSGGETEAEKPQRYRWDEFIDKVCDEKLKFLKENFSRIAGEEENPSKLSTGMSGFYKILELLREDEVIHLARFAYTLARMDPGNKNRGAAKPAYQAVREQFYAWYKDERDRKQLRTAVELAIYGIRKKD